MKKIALSFLFFFAFPLLTQAAVVSKVSGGRPTLTFTISANTGLIRAIGGKQYKLTLKTSGIEKVLVASGRGQSKVKVLTNSELEELWNAKDKGVFKDSPPNAVLSAQSLRPQAVIVETMQSGGDHLYFRLKSEKSLKSQSLLRITFTVDGPCGSSTCVKECSPNNLGCSICYNNINSIDYKSTFAAFEAEYPTCAAKYKECILYNMCTLRTCASGNQNCYKYVPNF